jgi:hypothetical protein
VYIHQFLYELVVLIICTIVANIGVCEKSKETLLLSLVLISANEVFVPPGFQFSGTRLTLL